MKFDQIKNLKIPEKHYSKKEIKKATSSYNIKSIRRYGDLAIILMYPGIKGSLRNLSTLVNDDKKQCSWICRISFLHNEWMISIGPHDGIDKSQISINVFEKFNKTFGNENEIYINGNLHIAFLKTRDKQDAEKIINFTISVFYNNEIPGIRNIPINKKFSFHNSQGPYNIIYDYEQKKPTKTETKNKELIKAIEKYTLSEKDQIVFNKIKESFDNDDLNIDILNELSLKYCSDKERLQIAIKFMS